MMEDSMLNILLCVIGMKSLRFRFRNVLQNSFSYCVRIHAHLYCPESIIPDKFFNVLKYREQLFIHNMKSPAGSGTIMEKDSVLEALYKERGSAWIFVDLDNIEVGLEDMQSKLSIVI